MNPAPREKIFPILAGANDMALVTIHAPAIRRRPNCHIG